jgi:multidrug transporter EmrE-like cation transporter
MISSWPRLVIGTLLLLVAAATGVLAWSLETCSGSSADSLWLGVATLVTNIAGWVLLGRRVPSKLVLFVAALPALAALSYSISTIQLATGLVKGLSACSVLKPGQDFAPDGQEPLFIILWLLVCVSFWAGLAPVLARAIRVHGGMANDA